MTITRTPATTEPVGTDLRREDRGHVEATEAHGDVERRPTGELLGVAVGALDDVDQRLTDHQDGHCAVPPIVSAALGARGRSGSVSALKA